MLEPVYPLTAGSSGKIVHKARARPLERVPARSRMAGPGWLEARDWPKFNRSRRRGCTGRRMRRTFRTAPMPWQRLAYDELLAGQLALRTRAAEPQDATAVGA